jgi:hypothetical protein
LFFTDQKKKKMNKGGSLKVLMRLLFKNLMRNLFTISSLYDFAGCHGDMKVDMANARSGEVKNLGTGRTGHSSLDNGRFWFGSSALQYRF